jgi:predicted nucleotidyltransferase component of viral defense system
MSPNVAASVRARLQNRARKEGRPFQELLQYYGLERFLWRLSRSPHRDKFILKGALLLRVWDASSSRPTRDIDLLGFTNNDIEAIKAIVVELCKAASDDDGVVFDPATVTGERIKEDADYEGIRIKFVGFLERARIPMQIDIAFGDVMHPAASDAQYPTLLDTPAPTLRVYPRETVIAEKFQAMVHLGTLNSRMKDFYDVWLLSRQFDFDGPSLAGAVAGTFNNRQTQMEIEPVALTSDFYDSEDKQKQWAAFLRKSQMASAPPKFGDVAIALRDFLLPIARSLAESREFNSTWSPPGPWTEG